MFLVAQGESYDKYCVHVVGVEVDGISVVENVIHNEKCV